MAANEQTTDEPIITQSAIDLLFEACCGFQVE